MSEDVRAPAVPVIQLGTADPAPLAPPPRPSLDAEAQLSSFLAHELATPVSTLVGLLYLLAEEPLTGRAGDLAERAFAAAGEVARTVHELRALPGGVPPDDVDAGEAAAEAVRGLPCPSGVSLTVDAPLPDDGARVRGNRALLAR